MPLLERESALASLAEYAGQARGAEGRLVLISGEAGVGKSALVERLAQDLTNARWLWGGCDGLFTPRPLGPLFDLADQLGGELQELCQIDAPRDALFRALLRAVSEPDPLTVVVLEDLHWADEATIDLLGFLGRRLRNAPLLLIATFRDDALAAGDPLRVALGGLASQRWTRRIGLAPLSARAVEQLAAGSGLEPAELYRLTSGNPFYVTEVIQARTAVVPVSARDAVLARAARLSPAAREVLDTAALLGTRVDPAVLAEVVDCAPSTLDELLASGLLAGDSGWLRFRHEIARIAVEEAVAPHRRRPLHARILDALRRHGSTDDAGLAYHAEAAGDAAAVLRHAVRAARRAAGLASHREAAAQYERAIRFADELDAAGRAALYDGLSDEDSLIDRWHDAATANERALALWREAGDPRREGDTLRRLSRTLWRLTRGGESAAAAQAAVAVLEPLGPSPELAKAYVSLASTWMLEGDDHAATLARRAQALGESLGLTEVVCDGLNTEACTAAVRGRPWLSQIQRALDLALANNMEAQAGRAYANIHGGLVDERRFAEAQRYYVDGTAYCDDRGINTFATCLRGGQSALLERTGRWDEAVRLTREVLGKVGASPINRVGALLRSGLIQVRRGEPSDCFAEATASAQGTGEAQWIVPTRLARTEAFWLDGQIADALREAELADDVCAQTNPWLRGEVAAWLHRLGSTRPPRLDIAEPYRRLVTGDRAGAAAIFTDLGCPYDLGLALIDGDEVDLRRALDVFVDLGATATARVARQRLRDLGARSIPTGARAATRAHPVGLTRREHEVLHLICAGRTNAEIATQLFISAKTVDHHVSAVLAKLGTPTRGAAARQARRLGLVTAGEN